MKIETMPPFIRILAAETLKLRRSKALQIIWLLPVVFIIIDVLFFARGALKIKDTPTSLVLLSTMPIKAIAILWAGYFHPLLIAVLPSQIFNPEHKGKTWKHLHTLPISRGKLFLAKSTIMLCVFALTLAFVGIGLWVEWGALTQINHFLEFPFPWKDTFRILGWSGLGSLPLLSLYLLLSDRIDNGIVPVVFGLIGMILTISFSSVEVDPSWRRDLIPWVLPYFCAQQEAEKQGTEKQIHPAAAFLPQERDLSVLLNRPREYRLPSGHKATVTYSNLPDWLIKPPPPTPPWLLAVFSLNIGGLLLFIGWVDSYRDRG